MNKLILFLFLSVGVTAWAINPKWVGWSDDNFLRAKKENRLVILDLQAIWCHWCHVMEETTYKDSSVNSLLSAKFIAVRVDQDSRPDISNRYGDYGWPATIIFNSNGQELAKRSGYIPPDKMIELLSQVVQHPDKPLDDEEPSGQKPTTEGILSQELQTDLTQLIDVKYDNQNGGWDIQHKFLDAGLLEYLIAESKLHKGDERYLKRAKQTLDSALALIDPVWGGVYQYSTDGNWVTPHFEKIMSTQTDNLKIYSLAFSLTHDDRYLAAAKKIQGFLTQFLLSPEGAFYTSQDADLVQGEHGGEYFKLGDPERRKKGIPRIDKNIYSRENGWAIQALVALYSATGDQAFLDQGIRAAKWIVNHRSLQVKKSGGFRHGQTDESGPYLGDSLAMGAAFMRLYMATGDRAWLKLAMGTAQFMALSFPNQTGTKVLGYFTSLSRSKILKATLDGDENVQLGRFANLLFFYTGDKKFLTLANQAMSYVANPSVARSIFTAPSLLLFQYELTHQPVHVTIVGHKDDPQALALFKAGLMYPTSYKRIDWWDKREGALINSDVTYPELSKAAAFACANQSCGLPAFDPPGLLKQITRISEFH